jgi:aconitate hydratase/homoaconitate hydratase
VWALKGAGVQVVIARIYAFIHKRNLVNEALPFLVMRDDAFFEAAVDDAPITVDLANGQCEVGGRVFQAEPPTRIVQALTTAGGIVPAIQAHGPGVFEVLTA